MILYHFSEDPTITIFHPRPAPASPALPPVVWAISAEHAPHYYFPRDCPRVIYWTHSGTTAEDRERFFSHTAAGKVIAIESSWLERVRRTHLYRYRLPVESFVLEDEPAQYYVSQQAVEPLSIEPIGDLLVALVQSGIELRITPSLWLLHAALVSTSLNFSMIRMRNATPAASG